MTDRAPVAVPRSQHATGGSVVRCATSSARPAAELPSHAFQPALLPLLFVLSGMVNCINTVAKEEGAKALWKGLTPFVGQLTLKYALRMGSNAFFLEMLRDKVRCARLQG